MGENETFLYTIHMMLNKSNNEKSFVHSSVVLFSLFHSENCWKCADFYFSHRFISNQTPSTQSFISFTPILFESIGNKHWEKFYIAKDIGKVVGFSTKYCLLHRVNPFPQLHFHLHILGPIPHNKDLWFKKAFHEMKWKKSRNVNHTKKKNIEKVAVFENSFLVNLFSSQSFIFIIWK